MLICSAVKLVVQFDRMLNYDMQYDIDIIYKDLKSLNVAIYCLRTSCSS